MSWSRRALLGVLALPLAGCGFHPMYSEREMAIDAPELAAITVAPIPNRVGQQLELSLREALNPDGLAVKPLYRLSVALTMNRVDLGIQINATSTSGRIDAYATLTLVQIDTGKPIYTSRTQSTAAFNILTDAYAAQVAEDDARTRTVRDIAAEIRTRLALFLRDRPRRPQQGTG
jgi:LPS-assembly lipoprotein